MGGWDAAPATRRLRRESGCAAAITSRQLLEPRIHASRYGNQPLLPAPFAPPPTCTAIGSLWANMTPPQPAFSYGLRTQRPVPRPCPAPPSQRRKRMAPGRLASSQPQGNLPTPRPISSCSSSVAAATAAEAAARRMAEQRRRAPQGGLPTLPEGWLDWSQAATLPTNNE